VAAAMDKAKGERERVRPRHVRERREKDIECREILFALATRCEHAASDSAAAPQS